MNKFLPTKAALIATGTTLVVLWAINNLEFLEPVKDHLNY